MGTLGNLILDLDLNSGSYDQKLEAKKQEAIKFANSVSASFKAVNLSLTPKVNDASLTALNKHLDLKKKHFIEIQGYFNANPLKTKVDFSQIDLLEKRLKGIKSVKTTVSAKSTADFSEEIKRFEVNTSNLTEAIKNLAKSIDVKPEPSKESKPEKVEVTKTEGTISKVFTGTFEGIGQKIGGLLTSEVSGALKRNFKLDPRGSIGKGLDTISQPVKVLITDNKQLQELAKKAEGILGSYILKAGYRLGDGVVASLESDATTIKGKINAFTKEALVGDEIKAGTKALREELKAVAKEFRGALLNKEVLAEPLKTVDENLRAYRSQALDDRAIPLVQQRAAEILEQKRTKNSAKLVNENTEEFIVASGGYAQARGLSGERIARDLKAENVPNREVAWIKNEDSDIAKTTGSLEKLQALMLSLAKPNLRGYSKDAVEMAAQGLAAHQRNPNITVKLLGESGGGFVAEEAAEILKKLGLTNVEHISVGTPDFIGRLDPKADNKIMSPDESLGAETHKLYAPMGFANVSSPSQQILGVQGHPYEHYKEAGVAELQNFLKGSPEPLSKNDLGQIEKAAKDFQSQDTSSMGVKELEDFSKAAYANLQTIRRHLLVAVGDEKKELQEIADAFESVYIKSIPDPKGYGDVRTVIKQAHDVYEQVLAQPGIEAGQVSSQVVKELNIYKKRFNEEFPKLSGIMGAKHQEINSELDFLIQGFSDKSLNAKKPDQTPVNIPLAQPKETEKVPIELEQKTIETQALQQIEAKPLVELKQQVIETANEIVAQTFNAVIKELETSEAGNTNSVSPENINVIKEKITKIKGLIKNADNFSQVEPSKSQGFSEYAAKELESVKNEVQSLINTMSPVEKTGTTEGNQLANLKSQILKIEENLKEVEKRLQGNSQNVSSDPASQIKDIGKTFSSQLSAAKELGIDSEEGQKIAKSIIESTKEARLAIDQLLESLGENATKEIRSAARTARGQITTAEKGASNFVSESESVGVDVTAGINKGIDSSIASVKESAQEIARALIDTTETELEIKSPSKVFERIGRFITEGLLKGLGSNANLYEQTGIPDLIEESEASKVSPSNNPSSTSNNTEIQPDQSFYTQASNALKEYGINVAALPKPLQFLANSALNVAKSVGSLGNALKIGAGAFAAWEIVSNIAPMLSQVNDRAKELFLEFSTAQDKVSTLSDDYKQVSASMVDLTGNIGNQQSSIELINASYDVLSSKTATLTQGLSDAQVATEILEAATKGSVGGFSDVGTVSSALTSTLNAYGASASEATAYTDKFIATQNAGKITVDEYAKFVGRLAPIAAQAGVGIDELNGFIATATVKGVRSEAAFDGIRQAISSVLKPSQQASDLAKVLGVEFDATALRTKGLAGILGELNARGLDTPEILTKLFGSVEAAAALAPSTGQGFGTLKDNIEASANSAGSSQSAFDKMSQGLKGVQRANENLKIEALISIGKGLSVALIPVYKAMNFLLASFNAMPEPIKQVVGSIGVLSIGAIALAGVIGTLATLLPPIIAGFTTLKVVQLATAAATNILGIASATTGKAMLAGMLQAAAGILTMEIALAPILPIILALSAAALVLLAILNFDAVKGKLSEIFEATGIAGAMRTIGEAIKSIFEFEPIKNFFDFFKSQADAAFTYFKQQAQELKTAMRFSDFKQGNEDIDTVSVSVNALTGSGMSAAERSKALLTRIGNSNGDASPEDVKEAQNLVKANDLRIAQLKEQLEVVKAIKAVSPEQESSKQALISQIESTTGALESQNEALKDLNATFVEHGDTLDSIAKAYEDATRAIDNSSKTRNLEISQGVASGRFSPEQGANLDAQNGLTTANDKVSAAQANLDSLNGLANRTSDPAAKIEVQEQIKVAQDALLDAQLEAADGARGIRETMTSLGKSIQDFYRGIQDQAKEIEISTKQASITIAVNKAKTKLAQTISGFSDRFFGELVSGLGELIEKLYEPLQNALNNQSQIQGYQNQLRGQLEQAGDFRNQANSNGMPSGNSSSNAGIQQSGNVRNVATGTLSAQEYGASRSGGARQHAGQDLDYGVTDFAQSFVGGVVTAIRSDPGGYGNYIDIYNETLGIVERIAEMDEVLVEIGQNVSRGQNVGRGTRDTGVIHYEIRTDANSQGVGGNGYNGTVDPIEYLEQRGLARRQGSQLIALNGRTSNITEHYENDGHDHDPPPARPQQTQQAAPNTQGLTVKGQPISESQLAHARTIAEAGRAAGASQRDIEIAIMTAIQESVLQNIAHGDRDSQGLFQQRPSSWGSVDEIRDPRRSAMAFFTGTTAHNGSHTPGLLDLGDSRNSMSRNDAAQRVQRSGHPDAYAQWEGEAQRITAAVLGNGSSGSSGKDASANNAATSVSDPNITRGATLAQQNTQQLIQNANNVTNSQNGLANAQLGQLLQRLTQASITGNRNVDDTVRNAQRQREDEQLNSQTQTPQVEYQRQQLQIQRNFEDSNRENLQTLEDLERSLEALQAFKQGLADQAAQFPELLNNEDFKNLVAQTETSLTTTTSAIAEYNTLLEGARASAEQQLTFARVQYEKAEADRRFAARSNLQSAESTLVAQEVTSLNRQGRGTEALDASAYDQRNQLDLEVDGRRRDLDAQLIAQEITNEEYAKGIELLEAYNNVSLENINAQLEETKENAAFAYDSQLRQSNQDLGAALSQRFSGRGLGRSARDIDSAMAVDNENMRFDSQIRDIEAQGRAAGWSAEQVQALVDNATKLHDLNLGNITDQFSTMQEVMGGVQDSFSTAFKGLIDGSMSAGDALKSFLDGILSKISDMATQFIQNELFGWLTGSGQGGSALSGLFGGGQQGDSGGGLMQTLGGLFNAGSGAVSSASSGGGMSGTLGGIFQLGASLFGLAGGGEVNFNPGIDDLRKGNDPIAKALRKEGSAGKATLIAATVGERVLNLEETAKFNKLGLDSLLQGNIQGLRDGGTVGKMSTPKFNSVPSMATPSVQNVNITVPVTANGNNAPDINPAGIKKAIQAEIANQMISQARPGGINYKR